MIIFPLLLVHLICSNPTEKRLVKLSELGDAIEMTVGQIDGLISSQIHFMDITDHPETLMGIKSYSTDIPTSLSKTGLVNQGIELIDTVRMEKFLNEFTGFHNRYYNSEYGVNSTTFLFNQLNMASEMLNSSGRKVTIKRVHHKWLQDSIIVRLEGSDPILKEEVVVLGAHLDSINHRSLNKKEARAPGADDDGSGTVSVFEVFACILQSSIKPRRSIEFQFYAAEELGLLGSQDIAANYQKQGIKVVAQLQLDMTGYESASKKMGVIGDNTDPSLNKFLKLLIGQFSLYESENTKCGYACSDHASWSKYGFRSTFPNEAETYPYIHTKDDTVDKISFESIKEFVKVGLGFAIELAC